MVSSTLSFEKKEFNNKVFHFLLKNKEKTIIDISMSNEEELGDNFDIIFFFNESLTSLAQLNEDSIKKIILSQTIKERIREYKKIDHFILPVVKTIIYGAELAYIIYRKEVSTAKRMNLTIHSFETYMGMPDEGLLYSVINGVWSLLDFTPLKKLELKAYEKPYKILKMTYSQNIYDLIIPYSVKTKLISRDMSIDESLTSHHLGFENDLYEKGRQYQWLI